MNDSLQISNLKLRHLYAESVGGAVPGTDNYQEMYDKGTQEAAKVMITFPIAAMILGLSFTTFNLFARISIKIFMQGYNLALIGVYIMLVFIPSKVLYYGLGALLGFSSIIIQSAIYVLVNRYRSRDDYPNNRGLGNDTSIFTIAGQF